MRERDAEPAFDRVRVGLDQSHPPPPSAAAGHTLLGRLWLGSLGLLAVAALVPIWITRFIPALDDPNHLSAIYIWHGLSDPRSPLHQFYEARVAPVSYFAHYGLAYAFAFLIGVEAAHKLVLSIYVLSIPLAAFLWCQQTGRSRWLVLSTVPLAFSNAWAHGYESFNLGLAALLFAVLARDRLLMSPTLRSFLVASFAALFCYFGHPFPLALLFACSPVLWLIHRPRPSAFLFDVASLLPAAWMLRWQSHASHVPPDALQTILGKTFPVVTPEVWWSRLRDLPEHAVNPVAGYTDSGAFLVLVAICLTLWITSSLINRAAAPSDDQRGTSLATRLSRAIISSRSLLLALALCIPYLILPEHFDEPVYMWIARGRVAPVIAFFLLLSPPLRDDASRFASRFAPQLLRKLSYALLGVAFASALVVPLQMAVRYREFARHMQGMQDVLAACPASEQVLTARLGPTTFEGFDTDVFRSLPSWVQVVHGGFDPLSFPRPIPFPFVHTRRLPAPHWRQHDQYPRYMDPSIYGCVLVHNEVHPVRASGWRLAKAEGSWRLYVARR